jgi:hypothetical protein
MKCKIELVSAHVALPVRKIWRWAIPIMLLAMAWNNAAFAQTSGGSGDPAVSIQPVTTDRVEELERLVRELSAKLERLSAGATIVDPATSSTQPVPAAGSTAAQQNVAAPTAEPLQPVQEAESSRSFEPPELKFKGFTDVRFHAGGDEAKSFELGAIDLFMSSRISQHLSLLGELLVTPVPGNSVDVDFERIALRYSANKHFNLNIGRFHQNIGYWNSAFHHGNWLQTTVDRPSFYEFDNTGGFLPLVDIGLGADGLIPSGKLGLHYSAEVTNGRASHAPDADPVQKFQDENDRKAFNFGLYVKPDYLPGLQVGFTSYHDKLAPELAPKIDQSIWTLYAVFNRPAFEFLNEGIVVRHRLENAATTHNSAGFYSQISHRFGPIVRPYFRYEYFNVPEGDPYLKTVTRRNGPNAGVRLDVSRFANIKLEYGRTNRRGETSTNLFETVLAVTF